METIETAQADDQSAAIVAGVTGVLIEIDDSGAGLTCREIADRLNHPDHAERFPTLREVAIESGSTKAGRVDARRLGYSLRKYRDRVCNGFRIHGEVGHKKTVRWSTRRVESGGDVGDGGDTFLHLTRGMVCVSHKSSNTHTSLYGDGPESSPACPASPPVHRCDCGAEMIPSPAEPGWINLDCPACDAVRPLRWDDVGAVR